MIRLTTSIRYWGCDMNGRNKSLKYLFWNRRQATIAFTLVELLVVLAVISVLAGIALPTVKNSLREQRVARAASLLQSAIEEGRARSILAGGGGGVIIDRKGVDNIADRCESIQIRMATTPRPYTGDIANSKAKIGVNLGVVGDVTDDVVTLWFNPTSAQLTRSASDITNGIFPTLINIGDKVDIGDASLPLAITDIGFGTVADRNGAGLLTTDIPDALVTSWIRVTVTRPEENLDLTRFIGQNTTFSITRSPRTAIALPVEIPRGASIDLTASGIGRFGNEFSPMAVEGNYLTTTGAPFLTGPRDYESIFIIFGARGEISRILSGRIVAGVLQLAEFPVTGDVHLLVGRAGLIKTDPTGQLEDSDPDPLGDEARDGTTPLLDPESVWITIRSRSGDVVASSWVDPTDDATNLIPTEASPTNATRDLRIKAVIGRTRTSAVESDDLGSI